ncbi:hypothetical protein ACWCXH_14335 [Kitasatospora sp. NPDC001660]
MSESVYLPEGKPDPETVWVDHQVDLAWASFRAYHGDPEQWLTCERLALGRLLRKTRAEAELVLVNKHMADIDGSDAGKGGEGQ